MSSRPGMIDYLNAGLRSADLRQRAIASNLSNLHSSGYRRLDVKFQDALADAIESSSDASEVNSITGELFRPNTSAVGANGNDVSIDEEVGHLMSNSGRYKTLMAILRKNYDQMSMAMKTEG